MLSAQPKKWHSWDATLVDAEGRQVADVVLASWRKPGKVVLGGTEYLIRRDRIFMPTLLLEQEGAELISRVTTTP